MTHPGTPRDIDFPGWLDGISFKPANSEAKQLAHELVRQLVALIGAHLHDLLAPGRDKSIVFTALEDQVLMRANRALALGGGPRDGVTVEGLRDMLAETRAAAVQLGALLPQDPRIDDYKVAQRMAEELMAEQRGGLPAPADRPPLTPEKPFTRFLYRKGEEPGPVRELEVKFQEHWADPAVSVTLTNHDEGENYRESGSMDVNDPDVLEEFAAGFLAAANRLRATRSDLR